MSIFSDNIRFLRGKKNLSQAKTAVELLITRERYAKYEDGRSEPPIEILLRISKYHRVSIDLLVAIDIQKYPLDDIVKLPENRIVLPIKVDNTGENKIELVTQKAKMGYLNGYDDPAFIEGLQHISLPFLRNGKFRAFPAEGDSMPPYNEGTYFVGKYIESRNDLKKGKTYIFVTKDGIVYKRYSAQNDKGNFVKSDNQFYEPYEIEWAEVREIWQFAASINTKELTVENFEFQTVRNMFEEINAGIKYLKTYS
ncbi:XRE family transcriptional regulator [Chryseobacterium chendengshani]|uniref:XRE family transcriptional regulator n=1 Tax=Chryseobacterium sp. LJ756 TaxID=2864113 RepID=UPI001C641D45|nr:LexA family transcriptional regulator [Chryseobacterium sp. LJ756]MBW7675654.1 LexA family transcriptional regulator [Chryseobacterium sp. LJ756]